MSDQQLGSANKQYCILFYKYHPLSDNPGVLESYRQATKKLCASLQLTGRILIGLSNDSEGINGTLAGSKEDLDAYVMCMLGADVTTIASVVDQRRKEYIQAFRNASEQFFAKLNLPQLFLDSPNDFKWSSWSPPSSSSKDFESSSREGDENWFPDLHIKIVKEIISSGGAFIGISTNDTSVGYLTPKEWHQEIQALMEKRKRKQMQGGYPNDDDEKDDVETVLIDVRNHKECQIGAFAPGISIDPQTTTFAQFPKWVRENSAPSDVAVSDDVGKKVVSSSSSHQSLLSNKRILMYCTGGIRCEKASAFIRQVVPHNKGVYHLKGGIHKYLEEFGRDALPPDSVGCEDTETRKEDGTNECLFMGKNFVFDRRGALDAKGHGIDGYMNDKDTSSSRSSSNIIGKCQYCTCPYDVFHPACVCTVCREPILICETCQQDVHEQQTALRGLPLTSSDDGANSATVTTVCRAEFHCAMHSHLSSCYFTSIHGFSVAECKQQIEQLQLHYKELLCTGKKGKHKRRTLRRQIEKIESSLTDDTNAVSGDDCAMRCRHCGSTSCTSDCWGFHGGSTRMLNKYKECLDGNLEDVANKDNAVEARTDRKKRSRVPSNHRPGRRLKRENDLSEIAVLQLSSPPYQHRDDSTGLRVPPPVVRSLRSGAKGRWCNKSVKWVLNNDFGESTKGLAREHGDERMNKLIAAGLVRVNGVPVKTSDALLQNMDTLELIVHWHEPPVAVPPRISLTKQTLPANLLSSNSKDTSSSVLYCINKPSSVPIYPAGPYYANSLLLMVEAQEGLSPKSLIPLHRIDRATSGLLMCATASSVARVIQGIMTCNNARDQKFPPVMKLYLARVKGRFPVKCSESPMISNEYDSITSIKWCGDDMKVIEVNAPIAVQLESSTNKLGGDCNDDSNPMMHRTIRSDGKHSVSRFKLIAYDEATDCSLITCTPITGRGHQLRVHLQLIGYPIHNDVEYGGLANYEDMKKQGELSVQSMLEQIAATKQCLHEETIKDDDVDAALKLCQCCNSGIDGIKASFNAAQLLACGHAIDLHTYKYRLTLEDREQENKSKEQKLDECSGQMIDEEEKRAIIDMSVDLPPWAASFADLKPNDITWLI
ncbi:hypothetical protein ACHAXH_008357 [Discostella pseudostelligera]